MATLMCSAHLPWFHHQDNIWWQVHIMMLLIMQSSPFPCYFLLLSPIYFPQHPILKHRQPVSFPWYEGPNFTPISDNWQKPQLENFCFCSVYPLCTVRMTWRADMCWVLLPVMYRSITLSVLFGASSFWMLVSANKILALLSLSFAYWQRELNQTAWHAVPTFWASGHAVSISTQHTIGPGCVYVSIPNNQKVWWSNAEQSFFSQKLIRSLKVCWLSVKRLITVWAAFMYCFISKTLQFWAACILHV